MVVERLDGLMNGSGQARVVVCGEALVDMVPATVNGAAGYVPRPGGSPANVAVGLARLDVPTAFLGRVSTDPFGRLIRDHLQSNRVNLRYVSEGAELTTLAFVHDRGGGDVEYTFYAENSADRNLTQSDLPGAFPPLVGALHFGSLSMVLEPAASALEGLLGRERGSRVISLDPNVRPHLVRDADGYRSRLDRLVRLADLVKLSAADAGWLYPGAALDDVAGRWLGLGPALVLVTLGPAGSRAYGSSGAASEPGRAVDVADTVGAGDAFTAAALAWLHHTGRLDRGRLAGLSSLELADLLRDANRAAALACTRPGASPPLLTDLAGFARRA
jgi:fructokinase